MKILHTLPTKITALLVALAVTGLLATGCDFLDPTGVENPRTTDEDLAAATQPVRSLLPGVRAQFARALGSTVVATAVGTDDYSIHGTGLGGNAMDFPEQINPNTAVINSTGASLGTYWNLQELRALASFLLEEIAPGDERATDAQLAETHFYRGVGALMQAENYSYVPLARDEAPVPASQLFAVAEEDLLAVLSLDGGGDFALPAEAALARLYRGTGDATQAAQYAQSVLDEDPAFLFQQEYDAQNLVNAAHLFIVTRALKELQPLPRLDFLDPKFTSRSSGISVSKAEEMHLILAEVALDADQEADARQHLLDALDVVDARPSVSFFDNDERLDDELNPRPRSSEIQIAFEPGGEFVEGLVLDRPCPDGEECVVTPSVSGTSVTAEQINDASGTELVRLLYLMRQEIMLLEGRRLHDLGMRFPMMLTEIEQNASIAVGDPGTEMVIPAYIPPSNELDLYEPVVIYDGDELIEDQITMLHDMNRVLAEQRGLLVSNPDVP